MTLNTDFLLLLIFSHLMADYVFQTSKLAKNKAREFRGIQIHGIIVFLVNIIILSIYGLVGILIAVVISLAHFGIDFAKMKKGKYLKYDTVQFIIDQILHLLVIFVCSYWFRSLLNQPLVEFKYVSTLNYIIIISFVATVIAKILLDDIYRNSLKRQNFFIKGERIFDCLIILLVALAFFNTLTGIITLIIAIVTFSFVQKRYFQYMKYQILIKITVYFGIAFAFRFLL